MEKLELIATTTFGLEAIVKREILGLNYKILKSEDGKITYEGHKSAIAKSNLWLRCADKVLLKMGEGKVLSFEDLYQLTKSLPWEKWITEDGKFTVTGSSVKSKLFSVPDCQSIVKKAVVDRLSKHYHKEWFAETGAEYTIKITLLKDMAVLTINTSGSGLHKRGYRVKDVVAPMKETMASALVQLSFWNKSRVLIDPFCGSGTIPIEAALIERNIAPGLNRKFASENWPAIDKALWEHERKEAFRAIHYADDIKILASDMNNHAIQAAKENAIEAGVDDCITFRTLPFNKLEIPDPYSIIICNPPYGERLGDKEALKAIYNDFNRLFSNRKDLSLYLITSDKEFENSFSVRVPDRRRKLYNGRIETTYYQYYGEKPPRSFE